jgi:hypothetical protein
MEMAVSDYDMSIHQNPDARAWARFFMETKAKNPSIVDSEECMIGWFANAMMAMYDHMMGGGPLNGDHAQYLLDQEAGRGDTGWAEGLADPEGPSP